MPSHSFALVVRFSAVALVGFIAQPAAAQPPGPTQEHEIFKHDVGTWDATMKLFHAPGEEPTVSKATETGELVGGMWLVTRFEGQMMGMPFTGIGQWGYDPAEKKYVGTWIDNMTPYMQTIRGDFDPATKTMTAVSESRDPMSGEKIAYRQTTRRVDDDTRLFEMSMPGENGEYQKMLEIEYKRRAK